MPLGGSTISWDGQPLGGESVGLGDDRIRSMKTSVQQALANEHNFPSTGGANTGYHLPGSARAHFGTQSRVSSGDTDGRLMITSDTSLLFGTGSGGTSFLGSPYGLAFGSASSFTAYGSLSSLTWPQRNVWGIESGQTVTNGQSIATVTFPNSGFSAPPLVLVLPAPAYDATGIATDPNTVAYAWVEASRMTLVSRNRTSGASSNAVPVAWVAIGIRTL